MNQFKKAKQKALASGHQIENIKDLQTAGVKETGLAIEKNKELKSAPAQDNNNQKSVEKEDITPSNDLNTNNTIPEIQSENKLMNTSSIVDNSITKKSDVEHSESLTVTKDVNYTEKNNEISTETSIFKNDKISENTNISDIPTDDLSTYNQVDSYISDTISDTHSQNNISEYTATSENNTTEQILLQNSDDRNANTPQIQAELVQTNKFIDDSNASILSNKEESLIETNSLNIESVGSNIQPQLNIKDLSYEQPVNNSVQQNTYATSQNVSVPVNPKTINVPVNNQPHINKIDYNYINHSGVNESIHLHVNEQTEENDINTTLTGNYIIEQNIPMQPIYSVPSINNTHENIDLPYANQLPQNTPITSQQYIMEQPTPVSNSINSSTKAISHASSGNNSKQNSKKNIPNIFAPKNEAKSMRKSLVLKPTSVKIAENYCAKNGGSFNELIQTLLDNFIDEYGL